VDAASPGRGADRPGGRVTSPDLRGPAMEPVLTALARFVAATEAGTIPAGVRDHAGLVLADTVGAILAGSREPEIRRLHATAERAAGPATILAARFPRAEPWWAIAANGLAGTMLELDEGNRFARGHPGIHVVPASLAEAERLDAPGSALLAALVVGYEVAARLGGAPRSGRGCTCTGSTASSARRRRWPASGGSTWTGRPARSGSRRG
jgi:2-methylcitrate dehydratase PrpD